MRSAAFRLTTGAAAWIAVAVAALLLVRSEQHIARQTDALRAFDQRARDASAAIADARAAQEAYVAAGQGIEFWMPRATARADAARAVLAALRSAAGPAASAAVDQAAQATAEFGTIDTRVREYLRSGQQLMAGDVIFTEGIETAAAAGRQIETARHAERQAYDAAVAVIRRQEAATLVTASAVVALVVLMLVPAARRRAGEPLETSLSLGTAEIAPLPPPTSAATDAIKAAAALATDVGRVRDLDELTRVLGRAADLMDASGVMVWMGPPAGAELRPVLAHGYKPELIARIPPVARSADNAAAAAYRSGSLQIVLSRPGVSPGAVVAPILAAEGCVGALSAEIRHGGETSETTQALAAIFAAQLANVVATPADIERRAAGR